MNKRKSPRIYTEEFKWKVVKEVLSGKLSKEEARKLYSIKSKSAILYWMRKFSGNEDYRNIHTFGDKVLDMKSDKTPHIESTRIKELELLLEESNRRASLFQTMIEVAEEQLSIDIKKKFGAQLLKDLK
jgi:transposase-like protein